jgi:hypothetical protein
MSFADTFNSVVNDAWVRVVQENSESGMDRLLEVRRAALDTNLSSISAALSIASSPNPVVGLADMITMVTLQREVLERPETAQRFGEEGSVLITQVYVSQERAVWAIADRAMTPEQQAELRALIADWRRTHPTTTLVTSVRLQDFARARHEPPVSGASGGSLLALMALDPFASLDPAQRELRKSRMLGERTFYYATRMPQLLRWQAENLFDDLLHQPEFRQLLASANATSAAVTRITTVAENLPRDAAAEREAMLNQLFEKLAVERSAAADQVFAGLSGQREALLAELDNRNAAFQGTLRDLHETVRDSDTLANSLTAALKAGESLTDRAAPAAGEVLAQYRAAAAQTADTADRLTVLAQHLDKLTPLVQHLDNLLEPTSQGQEGSRVHAAAAGLGDTSKSVIDYGFHRLLVLVIVAPIAVALSAGLYRVATRRLAAG